MHCRRVIFSSCFPSSFALLYLNMHHVDLIDWNKERKLWMDLAKAKMAGSNEGKNWVSFLIIIERRYT
jgi:hypothetical protein